MDRQRSYIAHGALEIDNNAAERAMRTIALGRKNYLFVGCEAVGRAAAMGYTLTDTAKINAVYPQAWLAQGISPALLERTVYEPLSGQILSASFIDYAMARADDLPGFVLVDCGRPSAAYPLGAKGAAEVGTIGAPGAVMNAIADALGHSHVHMPATPEATWRALGRSALARRASAGLALHSHPS